MRTFKKVHAEIIRNIGGTKLKPSKNILIHFIFGLFDSEED